MTRSTSESAYFAICGNGTIDSMRARVYGFLYYNGPATARELTDRLALDGETATSYHKRLSELRSCGAVAERGERPCKITGHAAILWDVTGEMPSTRPRAASRGIDSERAGMIELARDLFEALSSSDPLRASAFRARLSKLTTPTQK